MLRTAMPFDTNFGLSRETITSDWQNAEHSTGVSYS